MSYRIEHLLPLADAAHDVRRSAAEHADEGDRSRRLSADVVNALLGAGFARHSVPVGFGGRDSSLAELLSALITVGAGCASAAWCGLTLASSSRIASFLPVAGQAEIWRNGPDTAVATALPPNGQATRVSGGWKVRGRWGYVSGIDFAEWVVLCAHVEGTAEAAPRFFAVPRAEFQVEDTWFSLGMRGTGSRTVVVDDVVVPEHRSCSQLSVLRGVSESEPGAAARAPVRGSMPALFVAPALGAVLDALPRWAEALEGKRYGGLTAAAYPTFQQQFARSTAEIDAVRMLLERVARTADEGPMAAATAARAARDAAVSAELTREALDRLIRSAGTAVQMDGHPLQRIWRDVQSATSHALLRIDINSGLFCETSWPTRGDE